eukprot:Rmarinus@m.13901
MWEYCLLLPVLLSSIRCCFAASVTSSTVDQYSFENSNVAVFRVTFDEPLDLVWGNGSRIGLDGLSHEENQDGNYLYCWECAGCITQEECLECEECRQILEASYQLFGFASMTCTDREGSSFDIASTNGNCSIIGYPTILLPNPGMIDPGLALVHIQSTYPTDFQLSFYPNEISFFLTLSVEDGDHVVHDVADLNDCTLSIGPSADGRHLVGRNSDQPVALSGVTFEDDSLTCDYEGISALLSAFLNVMDHLATTQTEDAVTHAALHFDFFNISRIYRGCNAFANSLLQFDLQEVSVVTDECMYLPGEEEYETDPCCHPDQYCCEASTVIAWRELPSQADRDRVSEVCAPAHEANAIKALEDLFRTRHRVHHPFEGCLATESFTTDDVDAVTSAGAECEWRLWNDFVGGAPCGEHCYTGCSYEYCDLPTAGEYPDRFMDCLFADLDEHVQRYMRNRWNLTGSNTDEEFHARFLQEFEAFDCLGPSAAPYQERVSAVADCEQLPCGVKCAYTDEVVAGDADDCVESTQLCSACDPEDKLVDVCWENCIDQNPSDPLSQFRCSALCVLRGCRESCALRPEECAANCRNTTYCTTPSVCSNGFCLILEDPDPETGLCEDRSICPYPPWITVPSNTSCNSELCSAPTCELCRAVEGTHPTPVCVVSASTAVDCAEHAGATWDGSTEVCYVPEYAYKPDYCEVVGHRYVDSCLSLSLAECSLCSSPSAAGCPLRTPSSCYVEPITPCVDAAACEDTWICDAAYLFQSETNVIPWGYGCGFEYPRSSATCDANDLHSSPNYCSNHVVSEAECGVLCTDECANAVNGVCEDEVAALANGLDGSTCAHGSDCSDCGPRNPMWAVVCSDSCSLSSNGYCNDGGPSSLTSSCDYGTDCTDCGPRQPDLGWIDLAVVCVFEPEYGPAAHVSCAHIPGAALSGVGCVVTEPINCEAEGGTTVHLPRTSSECEALSVRGCDDFDPTGGVVTPRAGEECSRCGGQHDDVAPLAWRSGVWADSHAGLTAHPLISVEGGMTSANVWTPSIHQYDLADLLNDAAWVQRTIAIRSTNECRYNRILQSLKVIACACDSGAGDREDCSSLFTSAVAGEKVMCYLIDEQFEIGPLDFVTGKNTVPQDIDCLHLAVSVKAMSMFAQDDAGSDRLTSDILSSNTPEETNKFAIIRNQHGAVVAELLSDVVNVTFSLLHTGGQRGLYPADVYNGTLNDPMHTCFALGRQSSSFDVPDLAVLEGDSWRILEENLTVSEQQFCGTIRANGNYAAVARAVDYADARASDDDDDPLTGSDAALIYLACAIDAVLAVLALADLLYQYYQEGFLLTNGKVFHYFVIAFNLVRSVHLGLTPSGAVDDLNVGAYYIVTELPVFLFFSTFTFVVWVWRQTVKPVRRAHKPHGTHLRTRKAYNAVDRRYLAANLVLYVVFFIMVVVHEEVELSDEGRARLRRAYLGMVSSVSLCLASISIFSGLSMLRAIRKSIMTFDNKEMKVTLVKTTVLMCLMSGSFLVHSMVLFVSVLDVSIPSTPAKFVYLLFVEVFPFTALLAISTQRKAIRQNVRRVRSDTSSNTNTSGISAMYYRAGSNIPLQTSPFSAPRKYAPPQPPTPPRLPRIPSVGDSCEMEVSLGPAHSRAAAAAAA